MMDRFEKWKPALPRRWLHLLSGLMWSAVGVLLMRLAYGWLASLSLSAVLTRASLGALLAWAIYRFGFSRLAEMNIARIQRLPDRACVFAFQQWTSYPLVVFMVALGITLRHSAFPKPTLAILYIGIGGSLFFASIRYYAFLMKPKRQSKPDLAKSFQKPRH
jgi:ABC-type Fe3+-siderophore transport system permease subunit